MTTATTQIELARDEHNELRTFEEYQPDVLNLITIRCPSCNRAVYLRERHWKMWAFHNADHIALPCPVKKCGAIFTARQWARRLEAEVFEENGFLTAPYVAPQPLTRAEVSE